MRKKKLSKTIWQSKKSNANANNSLLDLNRRNKQGRVIRCNHAGLAWALVGKVWIPRHQTSQHMLRILVGPLRLIIALRMETSGKTNICPQQTATGRRPCVRPCRPLTRSPKLPSKPQVSVAG